MSMKMKRLLLSLFALVIIGVFTTRANCTTDDNVVKKEIVVNQDKSDYDRSDPYSIKVYYLPLSSEIEVNCLDQGGVAVYLFNSRSTTVTGTNISVQDVSVINGAKLTLVGNVSIGSTSFVESGSSLEIRQR